MTNLIEIEIAERGAFAGGHAFAGTGAYERLLGRAHFAVDPRAPAQQGIVDLDKAPVDARGLVRFAADIMILKPLELARGNRRLFLDYGNRGNKRMLQFFSDAPASNDPRTLEHAGNGFLMRRGYTVAWIAGLAGMDWWRFFFWNAAGGIVWATLVGVIAYTSGKAAAEAIARYGIYAGIAIAVIVVVGWFISHKVLRRIEKNL